MISATEWAQFETTLESFNNEVGQQPVLWLSTSINLDRYGEGDTPTFEERTLKCIVSYNSFKTWPILTEELAGSIDKEYCHLLLNNKYLDSNQWLDSDNNFIYNPHSDTFVINGITYEPAGDTPVSQDINKPLYNILILKRKTTQTPSKRT